MDNLKIMYGNLSVKNRNINSYFYQNSIEGFGKYRFLGYSFGYFDLESLRQSLVFYILRKIIFLFL